MSFNFGTSSAFGSAPNKPTAFGSPFGTPATTASTGFGFGSTFGAQNAQQPAFGSTTFGQPATGSVAPTFGSTFGQPIAAAAAPAFGSSAFGAPATSTPAFGSTFGTPATSTPAFGSSFGTAATPAPAFGASAFGTPATSAPAFGSTFGTTTSAAAPAFGASAFGAPATSVPSLFGSNAAKTTAPSLFGTTMSTTQAPSLFGNQPTSTPSLFGNTTSTAGPLFGSAFGAPATTTSTPSLFGSGGGFGLGAQPAATNTGFGLFGSTTTTTAPSLFGGFGKTATTASGFTGFGGTPGFGGFGGTTTTNAPTLFGTGTGLNSTFKPPGAPQTAAPQTAEQQVCASIYAINVFGDERDVILKKWNLLQASWGTGKGYYNMSQMPVDYDSSNPFFRYRAIGYAVIPGEDNSCGLVKMNFNKKESELSSQKEALSNGILGILGNKPNLTVHIEHIKSIGDAQCEVMFSVSEKGVTGSSRKIPALDLSNFLNQGVQKQQLANVGVTFVGAYVSPTQSQLIEYLRNPPVGIELRFWQTAQANNPNPRKFMPIPMNGFTDLRKRMLCEQYETNLHRDYLNRVAKEITELNKKHARSLAKVGELKQKYTELYHRLLKIIIKQEATRKLGMALQPEEEMLKGRFEQIITQMSLPSQYKGQLYEIRCKMNLVGSSNLQRVERYEIDPKVQSDISQFLKMEQSAIAHLINLINDDIKSLKIIAEGMESLRK